MCDKVQHLSPGGKGFEIAVKQELAPRQNVIPRFKLDLDCTESADRV